MEPRWSDIRCEGARRQTDPGYEFVYAHAVGREHLNCGTGFDSPDLVNRLIITNTCLAPIARSIAPPTAGIASGSPVCQVT